jgi:hypothetical protein
MTIRRTCACTLLLQILSVASVIGQELKDRPNTSGTNAEEGHDTLSLRLAPDRGMWYLSLLRDRRALVCRWNVPSTL